MLLYLLHYRPERGSYSSAQNYLHSINVYPHNGCYSAFCFQSNTEAGFYMRSTGSCLSHCVSIGLIFAAFVNSFSVRYLCSVASVHRTLFGLIQAVYPKHAT